MHMARGHCLSRVCLFLLSLPLGRISSDSSHRGAQSAKYFAVGLAQQRLDQLADAEASYERAIIEDAGDWPAGLRQKVSLYGEVLKWQGKQQAANEVFAAAAQSGLFESALERPLTTVDDSRLLHRTSAWYDDSEQDHWLPHLAKARQMLERIATEIRQEYIAYRTNHPDLVREHTDGLVAYPRGGWKQLTLEGSNKKADCMGYCPRTAAALKLIESELCHGRVCPRRAEFSILDAGAYLRPHCGPTHLSLTLHLGLVCPANSTVDEATEMSRSKEDQMPVSTKPNVAARFCLGGECREWREGKLFAFNEAVEHEAWGATAGERVVLLLKVPHPGLDFETYDRLYSEYLGNASILDAVRSHGEALFLADHAR